MQIGENTSAQMHSFPRLHEPYHKSLAPIYLNKFKHILWSLILHSAIPSSSPSTRLFVPERIATVILGSYSSFRGLILLSQHRWAHYLTKRFRSPRVLSCISRVWLTHAHDTVSATVVVRSHSFSNNFVSITFTQKFLNFSLDNIG